MFGTRFRWEKRSENDAQELLSICWQWTSSAHLDIEDIHAAPVFAQTLDLKWSDYEQPGITQFRDLLECVQPASPTRCTSI